MSRLFRFLPHSHVPSLADADGARPLGAPNKRLKTTPSYPEPFDDVAPSHRPHDSPEAAELFDSVVCSPDPTPLHLHLIEGVYSLLSNNSNNVEATLAVRALVALFLAMHVGARMVCVTKGSLIFKLRLPQDTAIQVRERVRKRPSELVDLRIRCLGFLLSNQCEVERLDEGDGAAPAYKYRAREAPHTHLHAHADSLPAQALRHARRKFENIFSIYLTLLTAQRSTLALTITHTSSCTLTRNLSRQMRPSRPSTIRCCHRC